jgi:predicted O-linked N-acetylglucosamine transferase (SPINDLY family)
LRLGDDAFTNLRAAATRSGIDPQRLINAPRIPEKTLHISRHACADLFLDTLTFSAHSTALDALWAGVPLITAPGETFQSRVTAAILRAAGLDDLVVEDTTAYEELAVELCARPPLLAEVKSRLDSGLAGPAFQTLRFVRSLEDAFREMWQRHAAGIKPADFAAPVFE